MVEFINEGMIIGFDACSEDSPSVADLVLCALIDFLYLFSKVNFRADVLAACGLFGPVACAL